MEIEVGNNYYFNDLINRYKQKYYNNNGLEPSFLNMLHNSKNYSKNTINKLSLQNIHSILSKFFLLLIQ